MTIQQLRTDESNEYFLPRFDSDAVRQVLLRASAIHEQQQQETLSAAQVETLAQELGISSSAVRQALGEATTQNVTPSTTVVNNQETLRPLTVAQMITTPLPGLLYGMFVACFVGSGISAVGLPGAVPYLLVLTISAIYLFPALLAFLLGWIRRDARAGTLVGLFLSILPLVAVSISSGLTMGVWRVHEPSWAAGMTSGCVALGSLGGWLRQRWDAEQVERRRLQNR